MKVHEINIYGDIVPFKWFNDGSEYDRSDLNKALDSLNINEGDELIYNIHTFGGCTTTAFSMYNKLLRFKNEKNINLTSRADGFCASSGVILLLAADKRIGSKYLKPFVHNAWTWMDAADKNDAKKVFESLDKVDNEIAELYSERTSISKDEALNLMNESRDVTLDECLDFGFYTEIENVYSSENNMILNSLKSQNSTNRNLIKMSKKQLSKKEAESKLEKALNSIKSLIFGGDEPQNKIVQDANGNEIDFYELEEDDTPEIGAKANVEGNSADGEYVMPNGETYVFASGELTEIQEAEEEEEEEETSEEMQALQDEVDALNKKLKKEQGTVKTLKAENKKLNKQFDDHEETLEEVQREILNVKKSIGSGFKNEEGNRKDKKNKGNQPTRRVWKETE